MAPGKALTRPTKPTNVLVRTETGVIVEFDPPCGPKDEPEVLRTSVLKTLNEAIAEAEHASGLRFATYLGDLGSDTRATAQGLLDSFGDDAPYTVLVAVSPAQRVAEIVTGTEAALRISDRAARVAVLSVTASCTDGDLGGALLNGIRVLADHAGDIPSKSMW